MSFPYTKESFTPGEEVILRRYVTNIDQPIFALVNLPEVVKGALFARYSRSSKSLRRLFLDEFLGDLDIRGDETVDATVGLRRAEELYQRVFLEYGDDSVAQLGGVHLACEQASNVLTKVLERGRLMAYLEQSTRYLGYDARLINGQYRYFRPPEILDSALGARYIGTMDRLFDTYSELLPEMQSWLARRFPPAAGDADVVHRRAIRAKALDTLRGLLPAASLSNLGIFGSGQSFELLLLHLHEHPLPEARRYGEMMLTELRKVIPSFLSRVDKPDRGGAWSHYLASRRDDTAQLVRHLWPEEVELDGRRPQLTGDHPSASSGSVFSEASPSIHSSNDEVALLDWDPDGEVKVLAAAAFPYSHLSERELSSRIDRLGADERTALLRAYVGERTNRRQRPGRAFERTDYRFEIVTDYGAFRDLQRHRLLTVDWQELSPNLGFEIPAFVSEIQRENAYALAMERSQDLYEALLPIFPSQAAYAVALGFRIRFVLQLNAREAMHLVELRSGAQGHPTYRRIAQLMHQAIADQAGHQALARAMCFVDYDGADLERLDAERRIEAKRQATPPLKPLTASGGSEPNTKRLGRSRHKNNPKIP